jgi:hypothetical protein
LKAGRISRLWAGLRELIAIQVPSYVRGRKGLFTGIALAALLTLIGGWAYLTAVHTPLETLAAWSSFWQAVGTLAAVFVALGAALYETARLRGDRRRAQATLVSAWADVSADVVVLNNASVAPVYEVIALLVLVRGAGPRTGRELVSLGLDDQWSCIDVLPPGRWYIDLPQGWGGMMRWPGIEVAFRDAASLDSWRRDAAAGSNECRNRPLPTMVFLRLTHTRNSGPNEGGRVG